MDFSQYFDIRSIISALVVAAILGIITLVWKKRKYFAQQFKNISAFLRLPQVKEFILDVYQRIFQSYKKNETKPSLQDYMRSFGQWKSHSETGITLNITVDDEPEIYDNVISISVSRMNPFSPIPTYNLHIEYLKPGYALCTQGILGVRQKEIFRIARLIYYRVIVESENNETVPHN
ncbi:MAG: hypothetical protein OXU23_27075 [Candidatus Poribacteria bacterium]|nr:hypothetical protein [Candidatus Poribacteria bacterium]